MSTPDRLFAGVMTSRYTLRPAGPEDVAALVAIDAANPVPWSARQFADAVARNSEGDGAVLVAHCGDRLDGFVVYSRVLDEVSIHNIAVRPGQQGRGLGGTLLVRSLALMKRAGAARCLLEVRASNVAARRLYASTGFTLDGERKDYYPAGAGREDALLMSMKL